MDPEHPKARAFAYWILGYQDFYEPVVRAWFQDEGYEAVEPRTVVGEALEPSLRHLVDGEHEYDAPAACIERASKELGRKAAGTQTRVQLDILLRDERGLWTGECKSWGGYSNAVTWKEVESIFVRGDGGLFLFLSEIRGEPVAGNVLVLWRRSDEHELIEERMSEYYGRPVRLFYLDEIVKRPKRRTAEEIAVRLRLLDEAVEMAKRLLGG